MSDEKNILFGAIFAAGVFILEWGFSQVWRIFAELLGYGFAGHPRLLFFALLCALGFVVSEFKEVDSKYIFLGMSFGFIATMLFRTIQYVVF